MKPTDCRAIVWFDVEWHLLCSAVLCRAVLCCVLCNVVPGSGFCRFALASTFKLCNLFYLFCTTDLEGLTFLCIFILFLISVYLLASHPLTLSSACPHFRLLFPFPFPFLAVISTLLLLLLGCTMWTSFDFGSWNLPNYKLWLFVLSYAQKGQNELTAIFALFYFALLCITIKAKHIKCTRKRLCEWFFSFYNLTCSIQKYKRWFFRVTEILFKFNFLLLFISK